MMIAAAKVNPIITLLILCPNIGHNIGLNIAVIIADTIAPAMIEGMIMMIEAITIAVIETPAEIAESATAFALARAFLNGSTVSVSGFRLSMNSVNSINGPTTGTLLRIASFFNFEKVWAA